MVFADSLRALSRRNPTMPIENFAQARTVSEPVDGSAIWMRDLADGAIREVCQRVASAWSRGDISALAATLAPDCDHVTLTRVHQVRRGREALLASWIDAFGRRSESFSVRMNVAVESIRTLRDDLALVDGVLEYSGGIGAGGVSQGRSSQPFAAVMVNRESEWLILSLRVGPATAAAKVISLVDNAPRQ
jgi:uncharacterized protein (TIGR02246 family)